MPFLNILPKPLADWMIVLDLDLDLALSLLLALPNATDAGTYPSWVGAKGNSLSNRLRKPLLVATWYGCLLVGVSLYSCIIFLKR